MRDASKPKSVALETITAAAATLAGLAGVGAGAIGCGLVIGLGDHELFVDAGSSAAQADGGAVADAGVSDEAEAQVATARCPVASCGGAVCCSETDSFGDQRTACQASCGFGQYAAGCAGPAECEAGTCCATMLAATSRRTQTSPVPPACDGWWFRGSSCGGCAPQTPNYCGQTFQASMCEKSSDCPFQQSCCHLLVGDPFAYCMDSITTTSLKPAGCLP